jgi:hypothetical protein
MKRIPLIAMIAFTAPETAARAQTIDPIPGSLTYREPPEQKPAQSKLDSLSNGHVVQHEFRRNGYNYRETYVYEPGTGARITERRLSRRSGFNSVPALPDQ